LGVPLVVRGDVVGALSIGRFEVHDFEPDDITVAQAFAEQVAAAVHNARLYRSVRQQAEALETAYGQLTDMERQRTDYYSLIVHDLRAPLTIASGYLELLEDEVGSGPLNDQQRMMLTGVRQATERMLTLANDLLDYSKIEAGFLSISPSKVDLVELLKTEVEELRMLAASNRQRLTWIPPLVPVFVHADPHRLRQVINNLVMNAVKYTPSGGQIEVRVKSDAGQARVEVQDNGPGVPVALQPGLFEAYRQLPMASSSRPIKGTGLGLFIVRHLVAAHGGQVGVVSSGEPGEGSTFWFSLPLAPSEAD
jgi:signal transduction histidine kinase